ncbi:MAG TPA: FHA domain-containing protein [Rhodanobacter sp.]
MRQRDQMPESPSAGRAAGPQGTRYFSTEALRRYASDLGDGGRGQATARQPVLEGCSPGVAGHRFTLREGRQAIGRRADSDIVIGDLSVSSCHAWVTNQRGRCVIVNTLSTNGTFVNDRRVHEVALQHGDHIRFGEAEFVFLTREAGQPNPAVHRWIGAAVLLPMFGVLVWLLLHSP